MRLCHKIGVGLPPEGTPRWFIAGPHRDRPRAIDLINIAAPWFWCCLWIEW